MEKTVYNGHHDFAGLCFCTPKKPAGKKVYKTQDDFDRVGACTPKISTGEKGEQKPTFNLTPNFKPWIQAFAKPGIKAGFAFVTHCLHVRQKPALLSLGSTTLSVLLQV
jgi:hypothetical protein